MTIDISGVSYWGNPVTIAAIIQVAVVLTSITLIAWGARIGNENLFYSGLMVGLTSMIFGSGMIYGVIGVEDYENRVFDFKTEALLTTYDDVVLTGRAFVANQNGVFIEGFLAEKSEGVFVVMEGK